MSTVTACPSCSSRHITVLPEASIEAFWANRAGAERSNDFLRVSIHLCGACGSLRFFALDPAAQRAAFGATAEARVAPAPGR